MMLVYIFAVAVVALCGAQEDIASTFVKPPFCKDNECPPYTVIGTFAGYELREYAPATWIETASNGVNYKSVKRTMFMKLFNYIRGNNVAERRIAMTVPVLRRVIPGSDTDFRMSFYATTGVETPEATDPAVSIVSKPAMRVYVKEFGGFANQNAYNEQAVALGDKLTADGKAYVSSYYFTGGYDAPWTRLNRHNEVWFLAE